MNEERTRITEENKMAEFADEVLHEAAIGGNTAEVVALLGRGADANARRDDSRQTPLMGAAEAGHEGVVRRLLEHGAQINAANKYGETALTLAADGGHTAVVSALLDWGADVNVVDEFGDTPLLNAAWGEHEDALRLLLRHRADPNVPNRVGQTAMTTALAFERRHILTILLEGGADPDLRHHDQTPLMMALGDEEAVRLLLAHGADTSLRDKHGKTALRIALEDCAHAAVPLLKAVGAKV